MRSLLTLPLIAGLCVLGSCFDFEGGAEPNVVGSWRIDMGDLLKQIQAQRLAIHGDTTPEARPPSDFVDRDPRAKSLDGVIIKFAADGSAEVNNKDLTRRATYVLQGKVVTLKQSGDNPELQDLILSLEGNLLTMENFGMSGEMGAHDLRPVFRRL